MSKSDGIDWTTSPGRHLMGEREYEEARETRAALQREFDANYSWAVVAPEEEEIISDFLAPESEESSTDDDTPETASEWAEKVLDAIDATYVPPQVGGDHYENFRIQPYAFITANGLGWDEGNVVKYITRWRDKNGLQDLLKAQWYLNRLIEKAS